MSRGDPIPPPRHVTQVSTTFSPTYFPAPRQTKLAEALPATGKERVPLPDQFTRQLVAHASLGVLDVQPIFNNPGRSKGELRRCQFWARAVTRGKGSTLWRVEGQSEVYNGEGMANAGPGDMHEVQLT